MAHPQHNFTSNFNGSEGHNAELTLNINGIEHKYTPAGNDKEFTVTGAVRIDINLDGSELVARIMTVLDGDSLPLLVQQNLDGTEDSYTYVGLQDNEWLFGRVTTTHIDSVAVSTSDGAVRRETLVLASDVAIVVYNDPAVYTKLRTAVALGHLPVLDYQGTYATYVTIDNNILKFATEAADPNVESYAYTVSSDNTVTATPRNAGVVRADSADTEPGTLIDKLEVVDNVRDPEDPQDVPLLSLETTVDGHGNRKVAINEDNLQYAFRDLSDAVLSVIDTLDSMDFDEVPHGSFGSSLNQSPGDGTSTSIQVSIFRPIEATVGDAISWTKTTEIGGEDFGTVTLEPGTYIICSDITCQWVGVPAGTYLPQVGNVLGEPFDFSQQQEVHRRMTNVVTVSTTTQFKMRINFDAATPVMGFWINSAQIVKVAGGMSQTNVAHDGTLTGKGSVTEPLGVTTDAFGKIKNIPTSISQFRNGDVIPVDGPNGPAKMPASELQDAILGGPVGEAVQAWLDDHPEATTTVQDHSLTNKKLVIGTLNFVTPEMFGAIGDGVTDDTVAIQQAVNSGYAVVFANKTYKVSVPSSYGSAITLNDNQVLLLNNAVLKLEPNNFDGYQVILISGVNNKIIGGHIVGDYDVHVGSTGEHGHGIFITSKNALVRDCEVKNCWGDGIMVTDGASSVLVENCHIHNNRRQGLTIGNSKQIIIKDCIIHDIGGTAPGAAIDIEPNANETASDIIIDGCEEYDNVSGFEIYKINNTVSISKVKFVNCKSSLSFRCWGGENVSVQNCSLNIVTIARGTKNFEAINCNLMCVNFERSTNSVFKGCNIECNTTRTAVFYFYVDGPVDGLISVGFYDCNVSTTSTSYIFRGGAFRDLVDELTISNCKIVNKSENWAGLLYYIPRKLFIKNSFIKGFSGTYDFLFTIHQDVIVRISDSVIENAVPVKCFLSYSANVDIAITNTSISKIKNFFLVQANNSVTGMFKTIANIMSETSLQDYDYAVESGASESLTKLSLPSIFTNS